MVIHSPTLAQRQIKGLEKRLEKAETALQLLATKPGQDANVLLLKVEQILKHHRFKRGNLPALPIYFQDENRIQGLMFLLTIALRVFTLVEFVVRRQLAQQEIPLTGLYQGNPKRATTRPTAERLLAAFCGITLYFHANESWEITSLNPQQKQILQLMGIDESIYILPDHFLQFSTR